MLLVYSLYSVDLKMEGNLDPFEVSSQGPNFDGKILEMLDV
jgi:hypothetical protein